MAIGRPSATQTLSAVERLVSDALPPAWTFRSSGEPGIGRRRLTTMWTVEAPYGSVASFAVETKQALLGPQLEPLLAQLGSLDGSPLVAAPYISRTIRGWLTSKGVSYADSTGNLRLVADQPGLFVERTGAIKDPWPSDDTLRSLRGRGAGRAIRALVDFRPPYGVRELAQRADVPLGSLSRTLDLLAREGLVTREERGAITNIDWEGTIRRWSQDYDFVRSNPVAYFLDPRGLGALASKLSDVKWDYATTGAFASQRYAPIAPARQAAIYVEDISRTAERLRLRPADAGANVVLAEPFDSVVFDRTAFRDDLRVVAPTQLAADLLAGPGREPSEGNELLVWMHKNEKAWRGRSAYRPSRRAVPP